jgi:hypothetical protein
MISPERMRIDINYSATKKPLGAVFFLPAVQQYPVFISRQLLPVRADANAGLACMKCQPAQFGN